jgi:adenosylcobinamide-phosphate synthase
MSFAGMMLVGMIVDVITGWPKAFYTRISHPVVWLGKLISMSETRLNRGSRSHRLFGGFIAVVLCLLAVVIPAVGLQSMLPNSISGLLIGGILAWPLIAVRSMHDHVHAVALPLEAGDIAAARDAVSMIVGRDPSQLNEEGVARAAIESLAENTSDGIVAPLFWGLIGGLPGIAAYKAINTLDSMIGHRSERYEAFGKAAAILDDIVNWIPARLTGLAFAIASGSGCMRALNCMIRDAQAHRSPNAGWPEGAMAGALGVRLSGPRAYGDTLVNEPWLNGAAADPSAKELRRALSLYRRTMAGMALALAALTLL